MSNSDCLTITEEVAPYLHDVESSTCLLLSSTPSPDQTNYNHHPLTADNIPIVSFNITGEVDESRLSEGLEGDNSSSGDSTSVLQDPVSAQLINNISMLDYQTLCKNEEITLGEHDESKRHGSLAQSSRKLPSFVNWNWELIRKVCVWVVLSALVACTAAVIAMIVTLPKTCNPILPWYQGTVFCEIFPAKFRDSNSDGVGDLKGLIKEIENIKSLGVSAIRLNNIYDSPEYPKKIENITSVISVDESLGSLEDFQTLVKKLHDIDMFLILDLPVISLAEQNNYNNETISDEWKDPMTMVIKFWSKTQNVDGFYLKQVEQFVDENYFQESLNIWKKIIGKNKIFIVSDEAINKAKGSNLNAILENVDLIDITLDIDNNIHNLKKQLYNILASDLWLKKSSPWVHWNTGSIRESRISSQISQQVISVLMMELILPGTVSIFYGDEIGVVNADDKYLVPAIWKNKYSSNLISSESNHQNIISNLIQVRKRSPTIYLNSIVKDGNTNINTKIGKTESDLLIIERWFPRRPTFVYVANMGQNVIEKDMSSMFYGGLVVASTNQSLINESFYFNQLVLNSNSALLIKLHK